MHHKQLHNLPPGKRVKQQVSPKHYQYEEMDLSLKNHTLSFPIHLPRN
jgi:hypothetical protein